MFAQDSFFAKTIQQFGGLTNDVKTLFVCRSILSAISFVPEVLTFTSEANEEKSDTLLAHVTKQLPPQPGKLQHVKPDMRALIPVKPHKDAT